MKSLSILAIVVLLIAGAAATLVRAVSAEDPISGTWGNSGKPYLELKHDGKGEITGTVVWYGPGQELRTPIKAGSFDPKTAAFKLEGDGKRPDTGEAATYTIEGKVENDAVSGTYRFGTVSGNFRFTKMS